MRPRGASTPFALRGLACALAGALALAVAAAPASAQAARPAAPAPPAAPRPEEDLRLSFIAAEQFDRLNPGSASLENSVATGSLDVGGEFDFRVALIPVNKKGANPTVNLSGRMMTSERALAESVPIEGDTTGRDTLSILPSARIIEFTGAVRIAYPLYQRNGVGITNAYLKAEVGTFFARDSHTPQMDVRTYSLGFERATGTFAGSFVDFGYGRDGAFGEIYGAKRYTVHVLIAGAISPASSRRGNLTAFLDMAVSTDNKGGPEGVRAQMGLKLDSDGVLRGVSGLIGGLLGT